MFLFFLLPAQGSAHRLDEYLQASTFALQENSVTLEIRLTPGVKVSRGIIAAIDTNRDGILSEAEQHAYEALVRRDLKLTVDSRTVPLRLKSVAFPSVALMRDGVGEIMFSFETDLLNGKSHHHLTFENHHQDKIGVYLVNCLFPSDPDIRVTAQVRNYRQSFYQLDYTVAPLSRSVTLRSVTSSAVRTKLWLWFGAGVLILLGALALLWRRQRQNTAVVTPVVRSGLFLAAVLGMLFLCSRVTAHPLSQGFLNVRVGDRSLTIHARVTVEEVTITNKAAALPNRSLAIPSRIASTVSSGPVSAAIRQAFEQHAAYLADHLRVVADNQTIAGRVVRVSPPFDRSLDTLAEYDLDYPLPQGLSPKIITLYNDVLDDGHFAPGAGWEMTYVVDVETASGISGAGFLLTRDEPLRFACAPRTGRSQNGSRTVFRAYFFHGVHHILTGYDHLLFISALVLAASTLWDLVKVVTAFTVAHTFTLTLTALGLVHLPRYVVEPLISASIVFVAIQNIFWPDQARGWSRFAAAFFFGLFHGLGFAGGLLNAMRGMPGEGLTMSLLAFSLGVEMGHQVVVLPLFAFLKAARYTRADVVSRQAFTLHVQRVGSAVIAAVGFYYFYLALV